METETDAKPEQEPEKQKPTPWYGYPRCDELPEPGTGQKWLAKGFQWAQDKVLKGAPAPLRWFANKYAPWKFKDPLGKCPLPEEDDKK